MAVVIVCDVCDTQFTPDAWTGLVMTIPGEMLETFVEDEQEYHACSWRCVAMLAKHYAPGIASRVEAREEVKIDEGALRRVEGISLDTEDGPYAEVLMGDDVQSNIQFGSTPLEERRQSDFEMPMDGITKDRQPIRLRRTDQ